MKKRLALMLFITVLLSGCASLVNPIESLEDWKQVNTDTNIITEGSCHSLLITTDGSLYSWGLNGSGQLGDGTTISKNEPFKIMNDVISVAAGNDHTLAIKADGTLWAWGFNDSGQLGDGTTTTRQYSVYEGFWDIIDNNNKSEPIKIMDDVVSASAGGNHSLAVKADGSLWGWGSNSYGQLGVYVKYDRTSPMKIMDGVASVAAGGSHSVILKNDGTVWTFGRNYNGCLGDGTSKDRNVPFKVMDSVISITAGHNSSMAIRADGSLWIWGDLAFGEPTKIMDNVAYVTAGGHHYLVVKTDGSLWAAGSNEYGQLGDGTNVYKSEAIKIMDDVVSAAAGYYHSIAVKADGSVWSFGWNKYGQLGDGTNTNSNISMPVLTNKAEDTKTPTFLMKLQPAPRRDYQAPRIEVAPVINTSEIFKYSITGKPTFIRRDGSIVDIPENIRWYDVVYDSNIEAPIGYVLANMDSKCALMDLSGNMISDFDFSIYFDTSGDYIEFYCRFGYLIVNMAESARMPRLIPDIDDPIPPLLGLFDLTTGQMVIEPNYDAMYFLSDMIYVSKNGHNYMLDFTGEILFDFGTERVSFIGKDIYWASIWDNYTLNMDTYELYEGQLDIPREKQDGDQKEKLIGNIRILEERTDAGIDRHYQLEDNTGNVLIPFGTYFLLDDLSPFIIGYPESFRDYYKFINNYQVDILNKKGELLVRTPLGFIYEARFPDALVVWINEETCILLEPNGDRIVLENMPKVEVSPYLN